MKPVRSVITYIRHRFAESRLEEMDDRLLKDIGISRSDIERVVRTGRS